MNGGLPLVVEMAPLLPSTDCRKALKAFDSALGWETVSLLVQVRGSGVCVCVGGVLDFETDGNHNVMLYNGPTLFLSINDHITHKKVIGKATPQVASPLNDL